MWFLEADLANTLWFSGPKFLLESEACWPKENVENVELPQQETRKVLLKTTIITESIIDQLIYQNSSYLRILRIIAYVHRVFYKQNRYQYLTHEELQSSFYRILHHIQHTAYQQEINSLHREETLKPCLQKLTPFLDKI